MKFLLRADASATQGTGHVMRCLTLSEELIRRSHNVALMTNNSGIEWLEQVIEVSKTEVIRVDQHLLPIEKCLAIAPDIVVTDSYEIPALEISRLAQMLPVMSIVDGDTRDIAATKYLDHNLGAEFENWPEEISGRMLAGSRYALVRNAVLHQKRNHPWKFQKEIPHVVAVMGGSDPTGTIIYVSKALIKLQGICTATVVVSDLWYEQVHSLVGTIEGIEIIRPTAQLPQVIAAADIAISASGTSAWELCSLGIPSLLIAVVDNQAKSLQRMIDSKLVLGIDLTGGRILNLFSQVEQMLLRLIEDQGLRKQLSIECEKYFDGLGKVRVVDNLEMLGKNQS